MDFLSNLSYCRNKKTNTFKQNKQQNQMYIHVKASETQPWNYKQIKHWITN